MKKKKPNIPQLYVSLMDLVQQYPVLVVDTLFYGPGMAMDLVNIRSRKIKRLIIIDKGNTWKNRFFILLHEVGHVFYLKKDNSLKLRKSLSTEKQANNTAIKILDLVEEHHDMSLAKEFVDFYNKLNKGTRRAKFIRE